MNIKGIHKRLFLFFVIFIILTYTISTTVAYTVKQEKASSLTVKKQPALYVIKYDKNGKAFKTQKSISFEKAQVLSQLMDKTQAKKNMIAKSSLTADQIFQIMKKAEIIPRTFSMEALRSEATEAFSDLKKSVTDESSIQDIILKALEKTDNHQLRHRITQHKTNFLGRLKLLATGALGKIGFTTRIPLFGRFGPPLPSVTLALGSHTLLPGLGTDVMLINAGPFLGDFTSVFNASYSGLGLSGVTLGFVGWMMFLIMPGVYTYVWAVGFYGLNLWLGLLVAQ